ncbi:unnamed protein product [Dovyalis caffra]|uniref:Transcription factor TCP2-like n=1 Tax=Dovyalis caffra TaxID=77055 RepID=A0AAV1SG19_9ROSI|nr:unnamed protein product [Dovyalis caffra]
MEEEEIQRQPCKFSRVGNGRNDTSRIAQKGNVDHQYPDEEEDGELKRSNLNSGGGTGGAVVDSRTINRLRGWHNTSRIIRVSRASGGKDRHSKVWTSKGLRDRRVRLSVTTAIQFYDLQDRLGYDQPSKAVEWLIKAAQDAIDELPPLNHSFPDTPKQLSDERRMSDGAEQGFDSADVELDDPNFCQNQNQHLSLSKSACSSTSETSKGSGLSLARSDIRVNRVKARERARERTAKEKEKENDSRIAHHHNLNPISQNSTFTELLTGGIGSVSNNNHRSSSNNNNTASPTGSEANLFQKASVARQWPLPPMDYFNTGLFGPSSSRTAHHSSGFPGQIQLGNSIPHAMTMSIPPFSVSGENHQEQLQHFPFVSDHLIPVAATTQPPAPGGDYNLNFTISSGLAAGFNRGTLQSNSSSPSLLSHLQRFSTSHIDGSTTNVPFFIGAASSQAMENHHHHNHQFPPGLQLCYGDGTRHSDQKGKGKN